MRKERILYIMGIDWQWIYQRPQIFAEKLARDYEVTVLFPRSVTTGNTKLPQVAGLEFRILWTLPYQEKNSLIGKLSAMLNAKLFKDINSFQVIYVGYPLYARYIPEEFKGRIIYDCMDNHEALYPDRKRVGRVMEQEKRLINRCDLLVTSAKQLQQKTDAIVGYSKSVLIRNGMEIHNICEVKASAWRENYSLCYIGTIAEWFDYDVIRHSLEQIPNIDYQLIGPANQRVEHPGIVYHGPKPHEELGEAMKDYDCLIMPFVVNDIVAAVDPVKLYEYIAFGKCIISVFYPEIERFDPYVYFYESREEYVELLRELAKEGFPPKYTAEQQKEFLQDNTWDERYRILKEEIEKNA